MTQTDTQISLSISCVVLFLANRSDESITEYIVFISNWKMSSCDPDSAVSGSCTLLWDPVDYFWVCWRNQKSQKNTHAHTNIPKCFANCSTIQSLRVSFFARRVKERERERNTLLSISMSNMSGMSDAISHLKCRTRNYDVMPKIRTPNFFHLWHFCSLPLSKFFWKLVYACTFHNQESTVLYAAHMFDCSLNCRMPSTQNYYFSTVCAM